jgi:prepilin-type N-terminal cleavage/methylation domain-containing protein
MPRWIQPPAFYLLQTHKNENTNMLNKLMNMRQQNEEGFTLIELMIVVVIIGILAAVAIPIFMNQQRQAMEASATSDIRSIQRSMNIYQVQNSALPDLNDNASYIKIFKEAGLYDDVAAQMTDKNYKRFSICIPDKTQNVYAIVAVSPMLVDSKADAQGKETVVVDQTGKVRRMTVNSTAPSTVGYGGALCAQALENYFPQANWQSTYGKWSGNLIQ